MGLPREIRNNVYALLLHTKRFDHQRQFNHNGIHLAILHVNKQVHAEVSKVLYEENCWVLLRMDWREHNRLEDLQVQDKNGIRSRIQLPKVDDFLGTPNMEISLKHKDANPDRQLWSYVISAYSLPHLL